MNNDYPFSDVALYALKGAGWTPSRSISPKRYQDAYAKEDMPLSPISETFLRSFGGLLIHYATRLGGQDVLGFIANDVVINLGRVLCQIEEEFGVGGLCPIGEYLFGLNLLLQAKDGKVYGLNDEETLFIGNSGEEAIDRIISGKEPGVLTSVYRKGQR